MDISKTDFKNDEEFAQHVRTIAKNISQETKGMDLNNLPSQIKQMVKFEEATLLSVATPFQLKQHLIDDINILCGECSSKIKKNRTAVAFTDLKFAIDLNAFGLCEKCNMYTFSNLYIYMKDNEINIDSFVNGEWISYVRAD